MDDVYQRSTKGTSVGETYVEVSSAYSVNHTFIRLITYDRSNENQATVQQVTLHNDTIRKLFEGIL